LRFLDLNTIEQFKGLIQESELSPIFFFKHSNRCFVSSKMKTSLEKQLKKFEGDVFILDVVKDRPISNEMASILDVEHQSPQFIVVSCKHPILVQSHWEIDASELNLPKI